MKVACFRHKSGRALLVVEAAGEAEARAALEATVRDAREWELEEVEEVE